MGSLGPGSGPRNRPVTRSSRFTNSSQSRRFPGRAVQTFTKMLSKITQEVQCYGKTEFLSPNSQPHTGLLGHCSPLRRLDFISVANQNANLQKIVVPQNTDCWQLFPDSKAHKTSYGVIYWENRKILLNCSKYISKLSLLRLWWVGFLTLLSVNRALRNLKAWRPWVVFILENMRNGM